MKGTKEKVILEREREKGEKREKKKRKQERCKEWEGEKNWNLKERRTEI